VRSYALSGIARAEADHPLTRLSRYARPADLSRHGLRKALHPEWRGGVTCKVLEGGRVAIGDEVAIVQSPPERQIKLPG